MMKHENLEKKAWIATIISDDIHEYYGFAIIADSVEEAKKFNVDFLRNNWKDELWFEESDLEQITYELAKNPINIDILPYGVLLSEELTVIHNLIAYNEDAEFECAVCKNTFYEANFKENVREEELLCIPCAQKYDSLQEKTVVNLRSIYKSGFRQVLCCADCKHLGVELKNKLLDYCDVHNFQLGETEKKEFICDDFEDNF